MTAPTTDSAMYQTIQRQPDDLRRLLSEGWSQATEAAGRLAAAQRLYLVGIGTSYHAALVGSWLFRAAGTDCRAVSSFDFATYPDSFPLRDGDAVIVMAHSGTKQHSSASLARAAAAGILALSVGSLTAEHPGSQLILRTVEREKSAAFTSSHLAAMTVLAQIATLLGEERAVPATAEFRANLATLPDLVAGVLDRDDEIVPVADMAVSRRVYAAGAGPNEATATEVVIKAREAAHAWIDGLALEQFLHGPLVTVNADDLAILVNVPGAASSRVAEIAAVLDRIGAHLWLVGEPVGATPNARVFTLPALPELLSPLLAVVPLQLFAYHLAALKGINPDTFRRDNPTYAEALGLLKL